jgi:hypothetical protein
MLSLLALWHQSPAAWSVMDWLCFILIVVGCVGIALIVLRVCGITVPPWVWQIGLIVLAVFLGILAIRFLASM